MPTDYSPPKRLPYKTLVGIPRHHTYRCKLAAKWRRKGFLVKFREQSGGLSYA